ncbi:MAG: cobalamin B12-binding domain-containing protein, partial [Rhodospirillales bacterium]
MPDEVKSVAPRQPRKTPKKAPSKSTRASRAKPPIRFVTAASLFDGHDAAINIMRRILQGRGAEVIHLGHNRSVDEVVTAAIQEDVQGIAISSYQGGHVEYFKYMVDLLRERGRPEIKVFGGGGGVIVADEIKALESYGVTRIYSPEDGRKMGLDGMIRDMIAKAEAGPAPPADLRGLGEGDCGALARVITGLELGLLTAPQIAEIRALAAGRAAAAPVLGVT